MLISPEQQQKQLPLQKSVRPLRSLKSAVEPVNSNEIWLLTLSDLLMLLMIFFVFLLASPLVQAGKSTQAGPVTKPAAQPPAAVEKPAAPPIVSRIPDSQNPPAATMEDDLHRILGQQDDRTGVTIERRSQFVVITFPEQILFHSGQAQLRTAAGPTLEKVAAFIISHPELSVEVQGHTDNRPIRSERYPSNWELSADRATQVAKMLVGLGANPQQIATKGFGEYHPIAPNISEADRLKNRRVEIQFSLSQS
ncbi:MAG: OmpA family protein [Deltaproteobacteria bacterium]